MPAILLLVTISLARVNSEQLQALFASVPPASECVAETATFAFATRLQCAALAVRSEGWQSFSFIGGTCVLSTSPDCTNSDAVTVFRKQREPLLSTGAPSTTTTAPSAAIGNEAFVDGRRFWVFQQRQTGTVSFARNWTEYEEGFGDSADFWSGLRALNRLTQPGNCTLRMEAVTMNYTYYVAEWSSFTVGDLSTNYTMNYSMYLESSSNGSESCMVESNGMQFSTFDRDNDISEPYHLSANFANSGFWYGSFVAFNPNGLFSTFDTLNSSYISCFNIFASPNAYSTLRSMRLMLQL